jgi:hypothetical protein
LPDVGEEIVGAYLRYIQKCELVQYNARILGDAGRGEIDVVGLNLADKNAFFCEVATHIRGLQYVRNGRPDNVARLVSKFRRDVKYAESYFRDYSHTFMLWSPVVRVPARPDTKYSQFRDVESVSAAVEKEFGIKLELVIKERYWEKLQELRKFAGMTSENVESPIIRLMQIEEWLRKHLSKNLG